MNLSELRKALRKIKKEHGKNTETLPIVVRPKYHGDLASYEDAEIVNVSICVDENNYPKNITIFC